MTVTKRVIGVFVGLCLAFAGAPSAAMAAYGDRVGGFRPKAMEVRIDKAGGKDRWRDVTSATRVFLVDKAGVRSRVDVDELVRGARIVGSKVKGGDVRSITVREKAATGAADCSFDSSEDDGDHVSDDDSFDCSNDYNDGRVDTDSDCSYDSSRDGGAGDWSLDASWDCSYSESSDGDDDGLDWDCSYDASAGGYQDADGGDVDADLSFDCSWSGASTDSALWSCKFLPGVLGFRCVSTQLNQEFEYTINLDNMAIDGGMDFQRDVVADEESGEDGVDCTGSAADGYDCSIDGESEAGDCEASWSFDKSGAVREGDISGDVSYSCSWESGGSPDDL